MDRINGSGTIDIGGGRRGFRDENLGAGVEGTEVTALFLNMLQEEVSKVIEDAGLVLNPADWTQLLQALRLKFSGRNAKAWVPVISMTITTPPATPAVGDIYLVPSAATDGWVGKAGFLAEWVGTSWVFTPPPNGHGISLPSGQVFEKIAGTYVEKLAIDVQSGKWNFAVAGGTVDAITVALSPAPTAYTDGMLIAVRLSGPNTITVPTINVNGLGAVSIVNGGGGPLNPGDLNLGPVLLFYRAAVFNVVNFFPATEGGRGVVELASATEVAAGSDLTRPPSVGRIAAAAQAGVWNYAAVGGTANALTASVTPAPASLSAGMLISFSAPFVPTGSTTFNLNGFGAKLIVWADQTLVSANDWGLGSLISLRYDGTNFQIQGISPSAVQSGRWNYAVAGGTPNAITAAISPGPTSWNAMIGMPIRLVMQSSPTGAATFNPNGLGAKSIVKRGGGAIADKEWLPGDIVELMYDGTVVRMIAAQRVGLDAAGFQTYSANVTLTILDLGKYTNLNQNCATVILPKASSCPSGSVIALHNTRQGLTNAVQAAVGDDITLGEQGAGAGLTSFSMANQESVMLVAYPAGNNWVAVTGSTQMRFTPGFKSSLGGSPGSSGFKRTPDSSSPTGFILEQWGFLTAAAANVAQLVTLPTAFPTTLLHCVASSGNSGVAAGVSNNGGSTSNIAAWAGATGAGIFWRAWGY